MSIVKRCQDIYIRSLCSLIRDILLLKYFLFHYKMNITVDILGYTVAACLLRHTAVDQSTEKKHLAEKDRALYCLDMVLFPVVDNSHLWGIVQHQLVVGTKHHNLLAHLQSDNSKRLLLWFVLHGRHIELQSLDFGFEKDHKHSKSTNNMIL